VLGPLAGRIPRALGFQQGRWAEGHPRTTPPVRAHRATSEAEDAAWSVRPPVARAERRRAGCSVVGIPAPPTCGFLPGISPADP
jgi:hypothetical protein